MTTKFFTNDVVKLDGRSGLWVVVNTVNHHALDVQSLSLSYTSIKTVSAQTATYVRTLGRTNSSF